MNLEPQDIKAIATKGSFVYCYLDSVFLQPYYIGLASSARRPFGDHGCSLPVHNGLVRVMKSGLTREEAREWEIFYIKHYGRKDLGIGILHNRTDGGEGHLNPSPETRAKWSKAASTPERIARMRAFAASMKGTTMSPERRAQASWNKGVPHSKEWSQKISLAMKGKPSPLKGTTFTAEHSQKISAALKGKAKTEAHLASMRVAFKFRGIRAKAKKAHTFGVSYLEWIEQTNWGRKKIRDANREAVAA